ncbi:DNA-binding transcriptional MocR family regulator [Kribbella sp. VKM Ac-2527]|uniref:DNA-binding transcriptional MocR family regulator n=1 Tax=Kribbella caucasensis TaxID=2512215 RepID=A0A4R6KC22_9ACTN|nr:PLP-dependent aminotransferase family protein [Kribbella sp. VKM Ac-2527]TDO47729.1 DNA-binding transcriptional MocR family regulator [Kribbella sp. VKM Ac-2527]
MAEDVPPQDGPTVSSAWLAEQIDEASAAGIAASIARLVRHGDLAPQTRLPTVRALAPRLDVSPATVSAAWMTLRKQRVLAGGGRQGTWVLGGLAVPRPARYENVSRLWPNQTLNLTRAVPDPLLMPDLSTAFQHALRDPSVHSYEVVSISDPLRAAAEESWPFPAEHWMCVSGGYEGLLLLLRTTVVPGEYVAIEEPATPRLLDILDNVGARAIPVATDQDGPVPASLREALRSDPVAFVYEPRSSSRLGASVTPERRDELVSLLAGTDTLVIEDDGLGELSAFPYYGVAAALPERSVLVRSYSKSHSPDLRLGIMAGAAEPIERVRVYRQFGSGWTSRFLQNALAWLLMDEDTKVAVDRARTAYQERREQLIGLLKVQGVESDGVDGLAVWVPVLSEHEALLVLASHGIAVAGAGASWTRPGPPAIRVAIGLEIPEPERVAAAIALAVQAR